MFVMSNFELSIHPSTDVRIGRRLDDLVARELGELVRGAFGAVDRDRGECELSPPGDVMARSPMK